MQFLKLLERAKATVPTSPHQASRVHGCHRLSVNRSGADTCPGTNAQPRPRRSGFNASRRVRLVHADRRGSERPGQQSATLIADQPSLKALMSTNDRLTVEDGSESLLETSHADLLVSENPRGDILAFHSKSDHVAEHLLFGLFTRSKFVIEPTDKRENMALVSQSATPNACRSDQMQRINQK